MSSHNRLTEAILMSSHNIPFLIYKKIILNYPKSAVTECFPRVSRIGWLVVLGLTAL